MANMKTEMSKDRAGSKPVSVLATAGVVAAVLIVVVLLGYLAIDKFKVMPGNKPAAPVAGKDGEVSPDDMKMLEQLGKILLLPKDVTPTIALVTDVEALKKQQPEFFVNAKNGDRVILYPGMAIIFDATANKIVKVGPIVQAQNSQIPFAIYNSSRDSNITAAVEEKLKKAFSNANVVIKANASKFDYPQNLIVDLVNKPEDAKKVVELLGGKLSTLPEGEKKPAGASILVIIGKQ